MPSASTHRNSYSPTLEPIRSGQTTGSSRRTASTYTTPRKASTASSTLTEKSSHYDDHKKKKKSKVWGEKALGAVCYILCFCCVLGGEKPTAASYHESRVAKGPQTRVRTRPVETGTYARRR